MKMVRTVLLVVVLCLLAVAGWGQSNQPLTSDILGAGKVDVTISGTNNAVANGLEGYARFGIVKNVEGLAGGGAGAGKGEGILGLKVGVAQSKLYTLSAGIYKYNTRDDIARPFVVGGAKFSGCDVYVGGVFYRDAVETHFSVYRPLTKSVTTLFDYQSSAGATPDFLHLDGIYKATKTTEFTAGIVARDLKYARYYPEFAMTFHLR